MTIGSYKVSFTTGDLFYVEAVKAVRLYVELNDWVAVRNHILAQNVFQSRTRATTGRILRELLPRLRLLTEVQLQILIDGDRKEQDQILWLAVCKQYQFIKEFAVEVIREKMLHLNMTLTYTDFDAFFNAKSEWHEELAGLTEQTRKKLRRVLFQMLRQADILSHTNEILPALLSPRVAQAILADEVDLFAVFPVRERDFFRQASQ